MIWSSTKFTFLLAGASATIARLAIWLGGIILAVTALEFSIFTLFLEKDFDARWLQKGLALVIMLIFVSIVSLTYVAISKLEHVKSYCKQKVVTEDEFYSRDPRELQKEWLESIAEKKK